MKVTLITACFNSAATIRTALESVFAQKGVDFEYLVIDGASTDGTVDILRECEGRPFRWISERDRGMYDAINKGIARATGDIVGILNADDVLATDDVLAQLVAGWERAEAERGPIDAVYGDIRFVCDASGASLAEVRDRPTVRYCSGRFFRPWMMRFGVQVAHPSFFCRRAAFARLGPYLTDFGMYADFELLVRYLVKARLRTAYLPLCTTVMRLGGASTNGLAATRKISASDLAALRRNGLRSCAFLLLLRFPFKLCGFFLRARGGSRASSGRSAS